MKPRFETVSQRLPKKKYRQPLYRTRIFGNTGHLPIAQRPSKVANFYLLGIYERKIGENSRKPIQEKNLHLINQPGTEARIDSGQGPTGHLCEKMKSEHEKERFSAVFLTCALVRSLVMVVMVMIAAASCAPVRTWSKRVSAETGI